MRFLFVGDVCGKIGRAALKRKVWEFKHKKNVDIVIANVENAAHGVGITRKLAQEIRDYGVDVLTLGDHTWKQKDIMEALEDTTIPMIRPANYPTDVVGKGYIIIERSGRRFAIINLLGKDFINDRNTLEPFRFVDNLLKQIGDVDGIIVDFHAEATAEKIAMGYFLDGRVSAVLGTHTHVQTADAKILDKGTLYITDVGMTGPANAVLWVKKEIIINRMQYPYYERFEIEEGNTAMFNAVVFDINDTKAKIVQVINETLTVNV